MLVVLFTLTLSACGGGGSEGSSGGETPIGDGNDGGNDGGSDGDGNGDEETTPTEILINNSSEASNISVQVSQELRLPFQVITEADEYQVEIETSLGIGAAVSNNELTITPNESAEVGVPEQVVIRVVEGNGEITEITINIKIVSDDVEFSEGFCFVGYCENNETVEKYINQANAYVDLHFTAFQNNQLVFSYALNPDFGEIENISFSSPQIEGGTISIDQSSQTVTLDLVQATHKESEADITFSITNISGQAESVTYTVYFLRSSGGRILLAPIHKPVPVIEGQSLAIDLNILDSNVYPENSVVELVSINNDLRAYGLDLSVENNTVSVTLEESFFESDTNNISETAYVNREILYRIRLPDGKMVEKSFYAPINLRLMTSEFADMYDHVESEFNTLADRTVALMEIDLAILFFDKVFALNNFEKPYQGDLNRFLATNNAGDIDNINYIKRVLNLDNGLPVSYKGFDEGSLEEIRQEIINKSDCWDSNNNCEARHNKVDLLNAYIEEYNNLTGSTYATISLDYFDNTLIAFDTHYSYFKGDNAYGEYVDGRFVFNQEYKYLQGLAESTSSYINLLIK